MFFLQLKSPPGDRVCVREKGDQNRPGNFVFRSRTKGIFDQPCKSKVNGKSCETETRPQKTSYYISRLVLGGSANGFETNKTRNFVKF